VPTSVFFARGTLTLSFSAAWEPSRCPKSLLIARASRAGVSHFARLLCPLFPVDLLRRVDDPIGQIVFSQLAVDLLSKFPRCC